MYWSDWSENGSRIYRSGMDGSSRIPFVSIAISGPYGMVIDRSTNRLYWADVNCTGHIFGHQNIEYISLNGTNRKVSVFSLIILVV